MLLIHVPRLTNRLGYTLNVLFRDVLRAKFSITTDEKHFLEHDGPKLSYGPHQVGDGVYLKSCNLLFNTSIEDLEPRPFQRDGQWMLFPVYGQGSDLPFDPLAAAFYMVSRYEEYLPHHKDLHGRFASEESLAVRTGFANEPVVEQWALMLKRLLTERYPDYTLPTPRYRMEQTVDIDAAWCYLHKGIFRTIVGLTRDLAARHDTAEAKRRIRVLLGRETDPYDTFDYIIEQRRRAPGSQLVFFALLADYDKYDKPSNYLNPHTRELLQHLDDHANMGLHPGYNSIEQPHNVDTEMRRLEEILHRNIIRARYHFLRLNLPLSYRILLRAGIKHDYTMGYADTTGFRAGISTPFPFYDLERDHETELILHPFCVMDTSLQRYLKLSPAEGLERYKILIDNIRKVGGTFCFIIHNQNLTDLYGWKGWREVYEQMLDLAKP
ncbi:MAG: polysaccharide deacetylase family protein [Bacteroidales bacterium]|nr:polysaccharide deacetylase family protein [Bacteroidales bacterium]